MVQVDFQKGEFNHILENTIDVVMSVYHIPKTNNIPKNQHHVPQSYIWGF